MGLIIKVSDSLVTISEARASDGTMSLVYSTLTDPLLPFKTHTRHHGAGKCCHHQGKYLHSDHGSSRIGQLPRGVGSPRNLVATFIYRETSGLYIASEVIR